MTIQHAWRIKAAHILVDTEAMAQQCIDWIEESDPQVKNQCFMNLAGMHSRCSSSLQGGELPEFGPGDMHKTFEQAVCRLRPGTWTQKPVPTPFGWHVIARIT
jgi:peptidyl-prolyl cis-trans isomerase C